MKNLTKRLTAFLAAAVMTLSAAGMTSYAEAGPLPYLTGWECGYKGWYYFYEADKEVRGQDYEIDGVLYSFDKEGLCTGKKSGLVKINGVQRRYIEGLPYTGWTKSKDGSRKYYLDGYTVTGDFQIGKKIYSFDKNGVCTGDKKAKFTADCGGKISSDTDMFSIKIRYNINDKSGFSACDPEVMERWENGKWVNCRDTASEFVTDDCLATIKYSQSGIVHFRPQDYTGNKFTTGYYRLKMNVNGNVFYTVFEVVPPIEIKMSEDRYLCTKSYCEVEAEVIVNSEKLKGQDFHPILSEHVYDDPYATWWDIDVFSHCSSVPIIEDESTSETKEEETEGAEKLYGDVDNFNYTYGNSYMAVLEIDGNEYSTIFRIEKLRTDTKATLKNGDIIVTVNFNNTYYKPITIDTGTFKLYNTGGNNISGARISDSEPVYKTLDPGEKITIKYTLSDFYDISKLKENFLQHYVFRIDGVGDADFWLEEEDISAYLKLKGEQRS